MQASYDGEGHNADHPSVTWRWCTDYAQDLITVQPQSLLVSIIK